jgi:hypothetical protein
VVLGNAQWHAGTVKAKELRSYPLLASSVSEKSALIWSPVCSGAAQDVK